MMTWRAFHDTGGNSPNRWAANVDITDRPCPSITNGVNGMNSCHFTIRQVPGDPPPIVTTNKPPYRVPLMSEIVNLPWNGFTVASTFSGAGGSCTGYRMAGYKVVWANEFVPAAQASYKANAAADCHLDCRDIKLVQPADIFAATGLKQGELDLFDGSPPCQAFSTAGKREKGWGKDKTYEHGAKQKNETLFSEYIRLLRGLMPKTFVAENVSGLVKGTAKGYFLEILRDLKASGYRVACKVLDAQWLGVPQQRQRAIFVGVRDDLGIDPVHPKPLAYRYSVRDALPEIERHSIKPTGSYVPEYRDSATHPAQAIATTTQGGSGSCEVKGERRKFTIAELKRICAFPDDFVLLGTYAQQWERLGNSVPPVMMFHIASAIRDNILGKLCLST